MRVLRRRVIPSMRHPRLDRITGAGRYLTARRRVARAPVIWLCDCAVCHSRDAPPRGCEWRVVPSCRGGMERRLNLYRVAHI